MSNRMVLPIVLTNVVTNEKELLDIFSIAAQGSGDSTGTLLTTWSNNTRTDVKFKETPEQIAEAIYKAYKKAGVTKVSI